MQDTNPNIKRDIQTLRPDSAKIDLYSLNLTIFGGTVHRFTPGPADGASVFFAGYEYTPLPVKVEGMEWKGDGKMPRPKVSISNVTMAMAAEVAAYRDLEGAEFTRIQTFEKYLDGHADENPQATYPSDIFFVERKLHQDGLFLQFELKALLDLEGIMVPARQVLPFCDHHYRVWNGTGFDYSMATCPYTDTDYYDETGAATTADKDKCGHKLFDCRLRFPSTNNPDDQLPARSMFPGVGNFGRPYRR